MTIKAIKLGLKKTEEKGYYKSTMKARKKKKSQGAWFDFGTMWRKIVFLIHILNVYNPWNIYSSKKEILKIPTNQGLYTQIHTQLCMHTIVHRYTQLCTHRFMWHNCVHT